MKKLIVLSILFAHILFYSSCALKIRYQPGKYRLEQVKRKAKRLKLPEKDVFYIDPTLFASLKQTYGKIPVRFQGMLLVNASGQILQIGDDSCSTGLLYDVKFFSELPPDTVTDKRILSYYEDLNKRIAQKPYTFLIFWMKGVPAFTYKQQIKTAKLYLNKCGDSCQVFYLNSNIYKEVLDKIDLIKSQ